MGGTLQTERMVGKRTGIPSPNFWGVKFIQWPSHAPFEGKHSGWGRHTGSKRFTVQALLLPDSREAQFVHQLSPSLHVGRLSVFEGGGESKSMPQFLGVNVTGFPLMLTTSGLFLMVEGWWVEEINLLDARKCGSRVRDQGKPPERNPRRRKLHRFTDQFSLGTKATS